jgi:hypothetical protein
LFSMYIYPKQNQNKAKDLSVRPRTEKAIGVDLRTLPRSRVSAQATLYAEGLAVDLPLCEMIWRAAERPPRAPVRQGRGHQRSSGRRLDLTWAHSSAPRAGTPRASRGCRHSHHTPRASATPTAITAHAEGGLR